jgi:hypothetical protein
MERLGVERDSSLRDRLPRRRVDHGSVDDGLWRFLRDGEARQGEDERRSRDAGAE